MLFFVDSLRFQRREVARHLLCVWRPSPRFTHQLRLRDKLYRLWSPDLISDSLTFIALDNDGLQCLAQTESCHAQDVSLALFVVNIVHEAVQIVAQEKRIFNAGFSKSELVAERIFISALLCIQH